MRSFIIIFMLLSGVLLFAEGTLFVGLEGSTPATFSSDMEGFPNINWTQHFSMNVSGAAATPDGRIYLCEGAFTTHLYQAGLNENPQQLCTIANDMSALAYGRETLWGYSNYASPRGIYSIDTASGATELALDVGAYRFFALDYNPEDDLFYGYTEYGTSGLYSIDIDSGEMIQLTGSIPATNGQGRGMAVGDNTAFLTATRGDDGIPYFAYDISQGVGGEWVEFPNPYPEYHSTGGAAWIAAPDEEVIISGRIVRNDFPEMGLADCEIILEGEMSYQTVTDENGDFVLAEIAFNANYDLEIFHPGFHLYLDDITVGIEDIDLGTIILMEIAYPVEFVFAEETVQYEEVTVTWQIAAPDSRVLESFTLYRFLESFSAVPALWDMLAEELMEDEYIDEGWSELPANLWQYAVVANYTGGVQSVAVLSNPLEKIVTETDGNAVPFTTCRINSIFPNPFNPTVVIEYSLSETVMIDLGIYNLKGQLVKILVSSNQNAGSYSTNWQGTDEAGNEMPSGLYLFVLKSNGAISQTKKVMLLK
jgi:hypothetical protein